MAAIVLSLLSVIGADPAWVGMQNSTSAQASLSSSTFAVERLPPVLDEIEIETPVAEAPLTDYYDPFGRQFAYGPQRSQPYRFGLRYYDDGTWQPSSKVRGADGSFQNVEWNGSTQYSRKVLDHWIVSWNPGWNTKWWSGPQNVALPPHVDQIFSDFQFTYARSGPWNVQLGITPQINSDFMRSLTSAAYMVDFRGVVLFQATPELRLAIGATFWNRISELVLSPTAARHHLDP